jgi:hypothetical protein
MTGRILKCWEKNINMTTPILKRRYGYLSGVIRSGFKVFHLPCHQLECYYTKAKNNPIAG